MELSSIILLYQLILAYEQSYAVLEDAFKRQDKELFDKAKDKILEIQKKIQILIE